MLKPDEHIVEASSCPKDRTHVSELNEYVLTADSQTIQFLCTAKVTGIRREKGWCYIGFARCTKKLLRDISSFTCLFCDNPSAVVPLGIVFVDFHMEMAELF